MLTLLLGHQRGGAFWVDEFLNAVVFVPSTAAGVSATSLLYLRVPAGPIVIARSLWRQRRLLLRLTVVLAPLWIGLSIYAVIGLFPPVALPLAFGAACLAAPWSLCVPVLMLENSHSVREALNRSSDLTRGMRRWLGYRLLVLTTLSGPVTVFFFFLVPWVGLQQLFGLDATAAAERLTPFGYVIGALVPPFLSIGLTLLYYDRRVRAEGYDLLLRVRELAPEGRVNSGL